MATPAITNSADGAKASALSGRSSKTAATKSQKNPATGKAKISSGRKWPSAPEFGSASVKVQAAALRQASRVARRALRPISLRQTLAPVTQSAPTATPRSRGSRVGLIARW
jgi:hypothetical protein